MSKKTLIILLIIFISITLIIGLLFIIKFLIIPLAPSQFDTYLTYVGVIIVGIIPLISNLLKIYEFIENRLFPHIKHTNNVEDNKRINWVDYPNLVGFGDYHLPFLSLINNWNNHLVCKIRLTHINISRYKEKFNLPAIFDNMNIDFDFRNDPSCRLFDYNIKLHRKRIEIDIIFQETLYGDYLKSGEHLDDPYFDGSYDSIRSYIGSIEPKSLLKLSKLTNICGVGIFIVTSDNYIILSKHSSYSHVYPERYTFSSSGLLKWGAYPHPITEIARKTYLEIQHQINIHNVKLVHFGADARKLYFQFCFIEETELKADDVINNYNHIIDKNNNSILIDRPTELIKVKLYLKDSFERIFDLNYSWEPAAESTFLNLLVDMFSYRDVCLMLNERKSEWNKKIMKDEWDIRASQRGDLPDMSVRYPFNRLNQEKEKYLDAIFNFMENDIENKNILEIGSGTGRVTERLIKNNAAKITCVDFCKKMKDRFEKRLGNDTSKINYQYKFAQNYETSVIHDIAICSLVLVHNVNNEDFDDLIKVICKACNIAYIFEDITRNRKTSNATRLCSEDILKNSFTTNGFTLDKFNGDYFLFKDNIGFFKFIRNNDNLGV